MKFKPYEEYKKVDLPWIEEIPSHWEINRGKNIFKKEKRKVLDKHEVITCFRDGEVTLRKNRRSSGFTESLKEIGYQGIKKGDLVVHQMDAFAGAVGVSDSDGKGSPVYSVCNGKISINNSYYAFVIREMARNGYIESLSRGIRERSTDFRFKTFAEQLYFIPPKGEQDKIADFLDNNLAKIDKFVELTERHIDLLKEEKEVIINDAVTKGIDKDVAYKDSGIDWIGEIPEHWEVTRLKYVANINPSIQADIETMDFNNKLVFLAMEDISENGEINQNNFKKLKEVKTGYTAFKKEDVIVAKITPCFENGKGSYLKKLKTNIGYGTTELVVLRKTDKIYGEYLYRVTKSHLFRKKGEMMMKGSAGQKRITSEFLNSFKLGLPPKKEQEEIVAYIEKEISKIDRTIELYKSQIELIKEYRTSLISSAVTGKIDVRDF